jgi:hypothetical protein
MSNAPEKKISGRKLTTGRFDAVCYKHHCNMIGMEAIAKTCGVSFSTVSKLISENYKDWHAKTGVS